MFVRCLLWQLAWRSAAEAFLWSARRSQDPEPGAAPLIVFFGSLAAGPLLIVPLLSFARWLLTGRPGPGLRFLLCDLGGPRQRVRSRSRSGSRPGRA